MNTPPGVDNKSDNQMPNASFGGDLNLHENEYLLKDITESEILRERDIHEDDTGGVAWMGDGQSHIQEHDSDPSSDIPWSAQNFQKAEKVATAEGPQLAENLRWPEEVGISIGVASHVPNPALLQGFAAPSNGTPSIMLPSFPIHVNAGDFLELDGLSTPIIDYLPYKLLGNLGHGGSASVEKIEDIHTGKVYARKIIRGVYARNIKAVKRELLNEVNIMKRLAAHHHMVKLHATYISRRELAMILDPVANGGDLAGFIEEIHDTRYRGDHLTADQFDILLQSFGCLASGLAFMHRHTIRHKDIKPQNILIHDGAVLYTDFGLAYDFADAGRSTTVGLVQGMTKRYCAPEVANGGSRNSRSDIFSLGCVYLEIINARLPNVLADGLIDGPFHEKLQALAQSGESFWTTAILSIEDQAWIESFNKFVSDMLEIIQSARPSASQLVRKIWEVVGIYSFCLDCQIGI